MLRQEMRLGYFDKIHRPGEKLGVFDNGSDFACCAQRTHCNATHMSLAPSVVWDGERGKYVLDDSGIEEKLQEFRGTMTGRRHTILTGAEHNNVYFPGFYHYRENLPRALMRDIHGNLLELRDPDILGGKPIPMPAIDDPDLWELYAKQLAAQASHMPGCHHVAAYVMGAEMMYPEFFNLGKGDYRPESWAHFQAWCGEMGVPVPEKEATLEDGSDARRLWLRFREQAMADRAAWYYQAILNQDDTHLAFYPTHGSPLYGTSRWGLGQQPDTLSAACDGIEMGHILVDDDAERRNVILTCFNCSYGKPVIVPRLGNKTPDLGAAGGGRSFTPQLLRRYLYEDLGMGISVLFPIHWRSHLHDGEWFLKDTPAEEECRKVFDEIIAASPYMAGMGRLQPQVGVLAADDAWLEGWNMRWTALMQDFLGEYVNATITTDALVDAGLSRRMPLLVLADDARVSEGTLQRLLAYLDGGGKIIVWGEFAQNLEEAKRALLLSHTGCRVSRAPTAGRRRVIREMFLTGMQEGTTGIRYEVDPVDTAALLAEIGEFAPEVVTRPFLVEDRAGDGAGTGSPGGDDPRGVNVYPLTDRAGMGAVLVNNGGDEHTLRLRPHPALLEDAVAVDMLTGQRVSMPVTLEPYGTRLLYFGKQPAAAGHWRDSEEAADLESAVCEAEDAYWRWKRLGANVGALRHNFSNMRSGGHFVKRYALAKALLSSLALRCTCQADEEGLRVWAEVFDAAGNPVSWGVRLDMTLTPGKPEKYVFEPGDGKYVCCIPRRELVKLYAPSSGRYVPYQGKVRLVLQAEAGEKQGGCIEHVLLSRAGQGME